MTNVNKANGIARVRGSIRPAGVRLRRVQKSIVTFLYDCCTSIQCSVERTHANFFDSPSHIERQIESRIHKLHFCTALLQTTEHG